MSLYHYVVVGYDATEESERALRWAVQEARMRRLELLVCHSWHWPYPISHHEYNVEPVVRRMAAHLAEAGASRARGLAPSVKTHVRLMRGPAYAGLIHQSHDADVIVVGSHEQGDLRIGSTALQLAARSRRPLLVVRDNPGARGAVVVGVDGSVASGHALGFAFEEAVLRGWRLHAVNGCWEFDAVADTELALFASKEELARGCGARLQSAVAPWLVRYPQVEVRTSVVMEEPRRALLDAAQDADLLVVGARGSGGMDPMLLGATSTAMLKYAPCTVAVVPDHAR